MTCIDQLSDDSGTYEACSACDENTHIPFLLACKRFVLMQVLVTYLIWMQIDNSLADKSINRVAPNLTITLAPTEPYRSAIVLPIPLVEPITSATFSLRFVIFQFLSLEAVKVVQSGT